MSGIDNAKVLFLINQLINDEIDSRQIDELAQICTLIASKYLQIFLRRRRNNSDPFLRIPDIAIDCIANLFFQEYRGSYPYFKRFFLHRAYSLENSENCMTALRILIFSTVQQYRREIYKQRDPEGAKIWRSIRLSLRHHPRMDLHKDITGLFVHYYSSAKTPVFRPSFAEVQSLAQRLFRPTMNTLQLLEILFQELATMHRQAIAVDIFYLVDLIKSSRHAIQYVNGFDSGDSVIFLLQQQELSACARKCLLKLKKKIQKYVADEKISLHQGLAFYEAMKDYACDMIAGEKTLDAFAYLKQHLPQLSRTEYQQTMSQIAEYLIRILKNDLQMSAEKIF